MEFRRVLFRSQAVEKAPPGHTLPILKSSHATQATVRFAGVKVLDDKGVEPDSGGRAPESLDQESVEREDVQQESAKSAVSQLAGARLPLEARSEEPPVGKECGGTWRSRWPAD